MSAQITEPIILPMPALLLRNLHLDARLPAWMGVGLCSYGRGTSRPKWPSDREQLFAGEEIIARVQ